MKEKVVFFGLSTEGYHLASKMVVNGADVKIIDESAQGAIVLNSEIAQTYTDVISPVSYTHLTLPTNREV